MAVIDIDKHLGKVRNRVYRVGIELEGGWAKSPPGLTLVRDGSIEGLAGALDPVTGQREPLQIGECQTPGGIELIKVRPWMKKYYPTHVNKSCGLHVHMSFTSAVHYSQLMVADYQDTMIEYLSRWAKKQGFGRNHVIWPRLQGMSQYCKLEFFPDDQARRTNKNYVHDGQGHRYTAINYCWGQHETVECRVLPMFPEAEVGIDAVHKVIDITNAFLVKTFKKEQKHRSEFVIGGGDDMYSEQRREIV